MREGSVAIWSPVILITIMFSIAVVALLVVTSSGAERYGLEGVFTEEVEGRNIFIQASSFAFLLSQNTLYADMDERPLYEQIRSYLRCESGELAGCGNAPSADDLNTSIRDSMNMYLSDAGIGKRPYFVEVTLEGNRVLLVERDVTIAIDRADRYENAVTRVKLPIYLKSGERGSIEIYVELGGMEVVVD